MNKKVKLSNGYIIPSIGYGTYQSPISEETTQNVLYALKCGYRHIDTATKYGNEKQVGIAIKKSKIKREDIFVTTKLWNTDQGYKNTIIAFNKSLKELNLKYVDLYLIHWPIPLGKEKSYKKLNIETWKAFEELYNKGLIKSIGVSNFEIEHLENILKNCKIKPMVNQIEMHPGVNNTKLLAFCKKNKIAIEAYAPMVHGHAGENPLLNKIANKYKKTVAQICLRWCLQHNAIPLPKSSHKERIKANFDVFNFKISDNDMKKINSDRFFKRVFPDPKKGK